MSRPEHLAPPEIFYGETEADKYTSNTRMIEIQSEMSERAIELLALEPNKPALLLDLGCGSGLSGEVLTEQGHYWIGLDIAPAMLKVALEKGVEGDLVLGDFGQGIPFRPASFDGAISISALQWLCNADRKEHNPKKRLMNFFQCLYNCLRRGARAVLQFYPENPDQVELITTNAMRCGFTGGLVVDYPNSTKAKKYFLVLFAGGPVNPDMPQALGTGDDKSVQDQIAVSQRARVSKEQRKQREREKRGVQTKGKAWVVAKKESQRKQGNEVRPDSKYTGRKRSGKSF